MMTTITVPVAQPAGQPDNSRPLSAVSIEMNESAKIRPASSKSNATTQPVPATSLMNSLSSRDKVRHAAMQATVVGLPLMIVVCLSALALYQARLTKQQVDQQLDLINDAVAIASCLTALRHEQEAACHVTAGHSAGGSISLASSEQLRQAYLSTDRQFERGRLQLDQHHSRVIALILVALDEARTAIDTTDRPMRCSQVTKLYESVVHPLVMRWVHHLTTSDKGETCQLLTTFQSITRAKQKFNNMNGFGVSFFSGESNLSLADLAQFHELRGGLNGLMDNSLDVVNGPIPPEHHHSDDETHFHWLMTMQSVMPNATTDWQRMRDVLLLQSIHRFNPSQEHNSFTVADWTVLFANMKALMNDVLARGQTMLFARLTAAVDGDDRRKQLLIVVIVATALVCPAVAIVYVWFVRAQRLAIVEAAEVVKQKSRLIQTEQAKANQLLSHMLPASVSEALRAGRTVSPESYQSASVLFADVIGFSPLVGAATPGQIVAILNNLYSGIDDILETHSCYKVEIVNDCVVISSGVPHRNGNRHSNELASTALDMLMRVSNQELPHIAGEHLLLRIGIHTGPCTTGVIGVNKPKFCLFGDVVNTSSRMMSSSEPMCVHISEATERHLQHTQPGVFTFEAREKRFIKGKGEMMTYWLLGKEGHEYIVDLKAAAEETRNATYFRRKRANVE